MLGKLREIVQDIAKAGSLDEALGILVGRVCTAMSVEVCTVYLMRPEGGELELRATQGLSPASVGRVRLPVGEGLVGLVAKSCEVLNVADAFEHPDFRYFPETGEELFRAFLAAPVVQHGGATGVLVVQQRANRHFREEEVDFLVTLAAQLAAILSDVVTGATLRAAPETRRENAGVVVGVAASRGIAIGTLVAQPLPLDDDPGAPEPTLDRRAEIESFSLAVSRLDAELLEGSERMSRLLPAETRALFDVYRLILTDEGLLEDVKRRIGEGLRARAAVHSVVSGRAAAFEAMSDEYLRARAEDIRALGQRLLHHLHGGAPGARDFPPRAVLVGEEVSLPRIAEVPAGQLAGIVCSGGSALSHAVVVARALGVPAVMGVAALPASELDGRDVIVDGFTGRVWVDPSPALVAEYARLEGEERAIDAALAELKDLPAESPDGERIPLYANVGLTPEIGRSIAAGASGVGLYRTEFAFMLRESFPSEEEQYLQYVEILSHFAPHPVTMRTLDVGGDKPLPYFSIQEKNPYLGWRGIRITLDHPEILLTQLRAMLRAHARHGNLRLLLPMVSRVDEVERFAALLDGVIERLAQDGVSAERPPLGIMLEVPAVAYQVPGFCELVDFLSVGTNDLTQYLLAVDRSNARVAPLYDGLHPAVLNALCRMADEVHACGRPLGVCGELAGDPAAAPLLLAAGMDWLSMAASAIPRVKRVIRTLERDLARSLLEEVLELRSAEEVRGRMYAALEAAGLGELVRAGR